jgi:FKBP-type peptidyl-prolyl cis-trans isomerase FklB
LRPKQIAMKNITLCLVFSASVFFSFGQAGTPKPAAKKPATAAKPATTQIKSALDSFSYAVGVSMAGFYKEQGVKNINTALVIKALNDVRDGKPRLDESQTNSCIVSYMTAIKSEKASGNKKEGQAFLDSNKSKAGVVTLPSGLQYQIIKEGTGAKPALTDKVKVHYEGSLLNGKIFDSSIQRGEPIELSVNGVIPGWTEALQLMPVGSKWKLFIPSDLAYGDSGAGADIKPGSTLLFDVELLDIVK